MCSPACSLLLVSALAACGGGDLTLPGPGDPAQLLIVSGDGQQGPPGALMPDPLVAQLLDAAGQPVSGRQVSFRFLSDMSGAAVDPGQASTDSLGQVSVHARLGQEAGLQPVEALVTRAGEDLRVQFGLRAKVPEAAPTPAPPPPDDGNPGSGGGKGGGGNGGNGGGGGGNGGDDHRGGHGGGGHGSGHGDNDEGNGHGGGGNGHGHDDD